MPETKALYACWATGPPRWTPMAKESLALAAKSRRDARQVQVTAVTGGEAASEHGDTDSAAELRTSAAPFPQPGRAAQAAARSSH